MFLVATLEILLGMVFRHLYGQNINHYSGRIDDFWSFPMIIVALAMLAILVIYIVAYTTSTITNGELLAFFQKNKRAYMEVARITQSMVIGGGLSKENPPMVDGSSWEQVDTTSERLVELRDWISWYNKTLASRRALSQNFFLRAWLAKLPAELEYIEFTAP